MHLSMVAAGLVGLLQTTDGETVGFDDLSGTLDNLLGRITFTGEDEEGFCKWYKESKKVNNFIQVKRLYPIISSLNKIL